MRSRSQERDKKHKQRQKLAKSKKDEILEKHRSYNRQRARTETGQQQTVRKENERIASKKYRSRKKKSPVIRVAYQRAQQHLLSANTARNTRTANENLLESENRRLSRTAQRRTRNRIGMEKAAINNLSDLDEDEIQEHFCGEMDASCAFCGARNFEVERPSDKKFNQCCHKGKINLEPLQPVPRYLFDLFTANNSKSKHFIENIRKYNNSFAMASMGANIQRLPAGPQCFKIQGQTYHRVSSLHPQPGEDRKFAQIYVLDSNEATNNRLANPVYGGCHRDILHQIDALLRLHNPFVKSYKTMFEIETATREHAVANNIPIKPTYMDFIVDKNTDKRRFNAPTTKTEVAIIFQTNEDGEPPNVRDLRIYPRSDKLQQLSILNPLVDPFVYPLFFFMGDKGWNPEIRQHDPETATYTSTRVSQLQYYSYRLADRTNNLFLHGGKLFQQFITDVYIRIEGNRLNYIKTHQPELMAECYSGLMDYIRTKANNANARVGRMVILPSSFQGSPRAMQQLYQDGMCVVTKYGKPDLFITMTCNKGWKEIVQNLLPGQSAEDRPDLVCRVFKIKLDELIHEITDLEIFGTVIGWMYCIEYQKRGLPHAHILLILASDSKIRTVDDIDKIVSAELPDKRLHPRLYEIVTKNMVHRPCGSLNGNNNSPCLDENGNCTKNFPKPFEQLTRANVDGYPAYRRRRGDYYMQRKKDGSGSVRVDNSWIIPYNAYLLLRFNCHINVEICSSVKSIKYIYKYIYKGMDAANIQVHQNPNQSVVKHDEVQDYINCRYLGSIEASWRLREYSLHDKSHSIVRLAVHLEKRQSVTYRPGEIQKALNKSETTLTAWFKLNSTAPEARQFTYIEIPYHYTFDRSTKTWKKRVRMTKIIPRIYSVSPQDTERFALRLLLLTVSGAQSFQDLKKLKLQHQQQEQEYETYTDAAKARGLLQDDGECEKCLEEAEKEKMPIQLREIFAFYLIFVAPTNSAALWDKFKDSLSEDFERRGITAPNKYFHCLRDIEEVLKQHGKTLEDFKLPDPPPSIVNIITNYHRPEELLKADENESKFNDEQASNFQIIMDSINNKDPNVSKCIFIDAPGGHGKTFLLNTVIHRVRGSGGKIGVAASTGIAATLLPDGVTAHSLFGIPVPVHGDSISTVKLGTEKEEFLRTADGFLWDEGSIPSADAFECVNKLLKFIRKSTATFGGATMIVSADFRQTLPVVKRGNKVKILEKCLKMSSLWKHFQILKLTQNMRARGDQAFVKFLLQIGNGEYPVETIGGKELIQLPKELVSSGNLIDEVFGSTLEEGSIEEIAKRVILCPKNKETLEINEKIQQRLPGNSKVYYGVDSTETDVAVEEDVAYPPEFLNTLTPGGMPPHRLELKPGSIVMLLRNLSTKKSLCNGTRLIVEELKDNFVVCRILSGSRANQVVFIPRIDLSPSDIDLPFKLRRRQFPLRLAFAMTISKSQGQTFEKVGIYLIEPVFGHGQLYVSLSRSTSMSGVKVLVLTSSLHGKLKRRSNAVFTKNIVYKEIFD